MSRIWTRIASTLVLVSLALPAGAAEYGTWKLIDTKSSKEFVPDGKAPTDKYGTWELVDVKPSKVFLADASLPPGSRYGQWDLVDVSLDRRWLGDQFVRRDDLGGSEVSRSQVSDEVERKNDLAGTGPKEFEKPVEKLLNPVTNEVILQQYKKRQEGRPVASLMEQYRVDTTYDKQVTRPWSQTLKYAESEKHTRTYDVTMDRKIRLVFKDPITGKENHEVSITTEKRQDVQSTGFVPTGKTMTERRKGQDQDPLVKVKETGKVSEREIGRVNESAAGSAKVTSGRAVAVSSGNLSFGSGASKVIYTGMEERRALNIDSIEVAKVKAKDKDAVSVSKNEKIGNSNFKVDLDLNTKTRTAVLGGEILSGGVRRKVDPLTLTLPRLPEKGETLTVYTGEALVVKLVNKNGKYELLVEGK